jgi:hypothetical protein
MTSTVYPVGGGLEDWAYSAGWDRAQGAAVQDCQPKTYSLPSNFQKDTDQVRSLIYLIETDKHKNPEHSTYG